MSRREHTINAVAAGRKAFRNAALAAAEETRDVTWIIVNGQVAAAVIPARNYHRPDECCCGNCPWNGNHAEPAPRAGARR